MVDCFLGIFCHMGLFTGSRTNCPMEGEINNMSMIQDTLDNLLDFCSLHFIWPGDLSAGIVFCASVSYFWGGANRRLFCDFMSYSFFHFSFFPLQYDLHH